MRYIQKSETVIEIEGVGSCDAGEMEGPEEIIIETIVAVNKEAEKRFGKDTTDLPLTAEIEIIHGYVIVHDVTLG